jgi:DNA polymerase III subunit delta'
MSRGQVAHAYLFAGPRSSGKTTTALAFASALNCASPTPDGDACGLCMSCVRIEAGGDADVQMISPDGDQTKMEQMQAMIKNLNFAPLSGKHRVFIIEQADTLNTHSENCILKVLEEPPSYAVLILLSSNPNSLLPTIRSRCRTVRFRRAKQEEVEEAVRGRFDLPAEEAHTIAACSQGLIGRAYRMAAGPDLLDERRIVLQSIREFVHQPPVTAIRTAEGLVTLAKPKKNDHDERTRVRRLTEMLEHILTWYADLLSMRVRNDESLITNVDYIDDLRAQARIYSAERLAQALRTIMDTRRYLEGNITPQLALECMFFDLRPD